MKRRQAPLPAAYQKTSAAEVQHNEAADLLTSVTASASVEALELAARAAEKAEGEEEE